MSYLSDIEIAQSAQMAPIQEIAEDMGLSKDDLDLYGNYKAKISAKPDMEKQGKMILVTAINPHTFIVAAPFAVTRPPSKELLEAIKEGENLARDPNAKTYASPKELWDDLGL